MYRDKTNFSSSSFLFFFVSRQRRKNAVLEKRHKTFKKGAKNKKSFSAMYHYSHDANTTQKRALTR